MMVAPKRLPPAGRQAREEFRMHRCFKSRAMVGVVCAIGLTVTAAWGQTLAPPSLVKAKLERLRIAVAPVGWDTNFTWLNPRSGNLDKRPALEFLVGIDRRTGAYIPELAEKWEMTSSMPVNADEELEIGRTHV